MKGSDATLAGMAALVCVILLTAGLDEWYARLIVAVALLVAAFILGMAAEYAAPSRRPTNREDTTR